MNELALFAGAGGGILAGQLLGWRCVCAVEHDAYAASVLVARQNDGCLEAFPVWDDVRTFDGRPWRGAVDVLSGGFPCQDISCAGKGVGIGGERSGLWSEMARIIGEVRPRFVFVENSPLLVSRGLGLVLSDLARLGFSARWGVVGADDAGAPHRRKRVWVLAYTSGIGGGAGFRKAGQERNGNQPANCGGDVANAASGEPRQQAERQGREDSGGGSQDCRGVTRTGAEDVSDSSGRGQPMHGSTPREPGYAPQFHEDVSNSDSQRGQLSTEREQPAEQQPRSDDAAGSIELADSANGWNVRRNGELGTVEEEHHAGGGAEDGGREWWSVEPDVGRVANGVASRVDRLRCIGNGQVPAAHNLAWRILSEGLI